MNETPEQPANPNELVLRSLAAKAQRNAEQAEDIFGLKQPTPKACEPTTTTQPNGGDDE